MIRVCMVCGEIFGEKEPFSDKSFTHGICDKCFPIEIDRIKRELKKLNKVDRKV